MIPEYRREFNASFTPDKYARFLREIDDRSGAHVKFRCSETPCFFPESLLQSMARAGQELVWQLVSDPDYLAAADRVIPAAYLAPGVDARPLFVQADFGIVRGENGEWLPKLVELQGFPSLYGFQLTLANAYRDAYGLGKELSTMLGGMSQTEYYSLLRRAIVGHHDPLNVVLLEIDPLEQKTLPDFLVTERICGIRTVDVRSVTRTGRQLFYIEGGRRVPIKRIYNRAIADELIRRDVHLAFDWRDDLDVEWAGHPNWFFRISKFSLPFLKHETVPRTWFLNEVQELPLAPEQLVLKPLFSFAGLGVTIGPTAEQIAAVPKDQRSSYILQEKMDFAATIHTPPGDAKAEVRVMYLSCGNGMDDLRPVNTIIRTGRGKMMGVDQNRDLDWVGASAGFHPVRT